jgi:nitric oxide reductase large subunit
MNAIKKLLGIIWIGLGLAAGYYLLINQAIPKFETGKQEDLIPAIIYTFVLAPIIVGGLGIFGYYSLTGEYGDK